MRRWRTDTCGGRPVSRLNMPRQPRRPAWPGRPASGHGAGADQQSDRPSASRSPRVRLRPPADVSRADATLFESQDVPDAPHLPLRHIHRQPHIEGQPPAHTSMISLPVASAAIARPDRDGRVHGSLMASPAEPRGGPPARPCHLERSYGPERSDRSYRWGSRRWRCRRLAPGPWPATDRGAARLQAAQHATVLVYTTRDTPAARRRSQHVAGNVNVGPVDDLLIGAHRR